MSVNELLIVLGITTCTMLTNMEDQYERTQQNEPVNENGLTACPASRCRAPTSQLTELYSWRPPTSLWPAHKDISCGLSGIREGVGGDPLSSLDCQVVSHRANNLERTKQRERERKQSPEMERNRGLVGGWDRRTGIIWTTGLLQKSMNEEVA